jgi:hypothetical protein
MDRLELLRVIKESEWPCKDNIEEVGNPEIQMASAREKLLRWLRDRAGLKELKVVTSEPDAHPEK